MDFRLAQEILGGMLVSQTIWDKNTNLVLALRVGCEDN